MKLSKLIILGLLSLIPIEYVMATTIYQTRTSWICILLIIYPVGLGWYLKTISYFLYTLIVKIMGISFSVLCTHLFMDVMATAEAFKMFDAPLLAIILGVVNVVVMIITFLIHFTILNRDE
ncbi:hypothetical protein ACN9US_09935 [Staphylococcus caprae]|uniref:hypothetical protein n=1 Tax=Staphylococcus caprae TaxID=29380 RepID=UPI001F58D5B2|nr:hypothetical protein [Staphylococcus caprae]MCI2954547.1 hypothetical protein [Staphylococcus caprae]